MTVGMPDDIGSDLVDLHGLDPAEIGALDPARLDAALALMARRLEQAVTVAGHEQGEPSLGKLFSKSRRKM